MKLLHPLTSIAFVGAIAASGTAMAADGPKKMADAQLDNVVAGTNYNHGSSWRGGGDSFRIGDVGNVRVGDVASGNQVSVLNGFKVLNGNLNGNTLLSGIAVGNSSYGGSR